MDSSDTSSHEESVTCRQCQHINVFKKGKKRTRKRKYSAIKSFQNPSLSIVSSSDEEKEQDNYRADISSSDSDNIQTGCGNQTIGSTSSTSFKMNPQNYGRPKRRKRLIHRPKNYWNRLLQIRNKRRDQSAPDQIGFGPTTRSMVKAISDSRNKLVSKKTIPVENEDGENNQDQTSDIANVVPHDGLSNSRPELIDDETVQSNQGDRSQSANVIPDDDSSNSRYTPIDNDNEVVANNPESIDASFNVTGDDEQVNMSEIDESGESNNLSYFQVGQKTVEKHYLQGAYRTYVTEIFQLDGLPEIDVIDKLSSLEKILQNILDQSLKDADQDDFIRVIIRSKNGSSHPISCEFTQLSCFNLAILMTAIASYAQSGLSWKISEGVEVQVKVLKLNSDAEIKGGGRKGFSNVNLDLTVRQAKGIVEITSQDNMCMARSVVVAMAKKKAKQDDKTWVKIRKADRNFQKDEAINLCIKSGVAPFELAGNKEAKKFESHLGIYIKIIASDLFNQITYDGMRENFRENVIPCEDNIIYLLRRTRFHDEAKTQRFSHYDPILKPKVFYDNQKFVCIFCNYGYDSLTSHKCRDIKKWCYSCWDRGCIKKNDPDNALESCDICRVKFQDDSCKTKHLGQNICKKAAYCLNCRKKIPRGHSIDPEGNDVFESNSEVLNSHTCSRQCHLCKEDITLDAFHECYIQKKEFKEPSDKYLFFDFETSQETGVHIPVFCHLTWSEEGVEGSWKEKSFGLKQNVLYDVGDFLFSEKFKGYTFIAHNMKGFDGCILLQYLGEKGIKPAPIFSGRKIMSLRLKTLDISIIDSLNFLLMPLSQFSKAFGLPESKGFFPHFFTKPENFNYQGPIPTPDMYGYNTMRTANRDLFLAWYNEQREANVIFNFKAEMLKYCRQDVLLLRDGCMAFKKLVMEMTKNKCDPFRYTTLASVAAAVYRAMFIPEKKIAAVPPNGYLHTQCFSTSSLEWLEYLRIKKGFSNIKHIGNSSTGEAKVGIYRLDGFDGETVFEFNGCSYHGCIKCFPNQFELHPVSRLTYDYLRRKTTKKKQFLRSQGYKVITMWECEWNLLKKKYQFIQDFVDENKFRLSPMDPFEGFMGGRVETFQMICENAGPIKYEDFTSLYPYVNSVKNYPTGHPEIILKKFVSKNLDELPEKYFGFIKCSILPPRKLFLPVLGSKIGKEKKLIFSLCRTCAENKERNCTHNAEERALKGLWFTEELKKAIQKGYKIMNVFGVFHFKESSTELFSDYIRMFYKLKLVSSGVPENCNTTEKLQEYIQRVKEKENIDISADEFCKNQGKRQISKLFSNSLWGRYGLRRNLPKHKFCSTIAEISPIFNDPQYQINDLTPIHENLALLTYKLANPAFFDINNDANIYIAICTTAYARLELYNQMEKLEERIIYCDTDSIIYHSEENNDLKTGNHLGELTNELPPGDYITDFASSGPKTYTYKTKDGNGVVKAKGADMSFTNAQVFNFESLKKIVSKAIMFPSVESEIEEQDSNAEYFPPTKKFKKNRTSLGHSHDITPDKPSAIANESYISLYNPSNIVRKSDFTILSRPEQKMFTFSYDKRVITSPDGKTAPYGY